MTARRARLVAVVATVGAVAGTAHAEDRARAEKYFRAGEAAYQAQNFDAAASNFEEAYKAYAIPEIAFSAAQAYRRQYRIDGNAAHVARAIVLYRAYLDKVTTGGRVADAADALGEMQHELDKLIKAGVKVSDELAAEHTQLGVNVTLAGTGAAGGLHEVEDRGAAAKAVVAIAVTLDRTKAIAPFALTNVAPGVHVFHVEAPGYQPKDVQERAVQGASQLVDVALEPLPAHVRVDTEAGARITVDGRPFGDAPHAAFDLRAGRYLLAVVRRGREPVARELELANGQTLAIAAPLRQTAQRRALPYVFGGAGVVAAGAAAAAIVAVLADRDARDLYTRAQTTGNLTPRDQAHYDDLAARRGEFRTAAAVAGGVAVAGALAGIGLWLFDNPTADSVRVAPTGNGAAIAGRF